MSRNDTASEPLARLRADTRRRWLGFLASGILFIVALICGGVGLIYRGSGLPGGMAWLTFSVIGILAAALLTTRNGRAAPGLLPEEPDASAVGALMERLDISFGAERRSVSQLLVHVLEHIDPADRVSIRRAERVRLNDALRVPDFRRNADLLTAIIRAYAVVGDEEAYELIETLASQPGEDGPERHVRDAARACLPLLEARLATRRSGAELLRASREGTTPDQLLRAATPAAGQSPAELLRATDPASPATERLRATDPATDQSPTNPLHATGQASHEVPQIEPPENTVSP